jgi:two-component system cell cycle sensor histidine kinase/response regulator CckA
VLVRLHSDRVPRPTRVLLVDDERMVLRALRRLILSRHPDWEVLCARSATVALGFLNDHGPIDVMVTDLSMPDVDGITLLGIVKERYPDVVRVAHSAHIESFVPQLMGGLCHELLAKPAGASELVGTLEAVRGSSKGAMVAG